MEKVFWTHNEAETGAVAQKMATITTRGDVWALSGTLGAGKSVFARAFIQHLTSADEVPSPTFTLVQTYWTDDFDIYHYDLYRLKDAMEIFELGVEEAFFSAVSLVEWPEKMAGFAPRNMWHVKIEPQGEARRITISTDDEEKFRRIQNV